MSDSLIGRRAKINDGMKEFIGRIGTIVSVEHSRPKQYRIRFSYPVKVAGVGEVMDDLWERGTFKLLRE